MGTADQVKHELDAQLREGGKLWDLANAMETFLEFGAVYQNWYSRALKIVEALAPDRHSEFVSYYLADPKRKSLDVGSYTIQDFIKGVLPRSLSKGGEQSEVNAVVRVRISNQLQILGSLRSRIDSVLEDVTGHLFAELQDRELQESAKLMKISPRAAGALAGVVLERHLQRTFANHGLSTKKTNPTISDLNDPLKKKGVYGVPVWRKIQLLADLRNLCAHQKDSDPGAEQVKELIDGVSSIVKTVF